jgi:hypothetical protein
MDVEGFSVLMSLAVAEHMKTERLLLCDNKNITFGPDGQLNCSPIVDEVALKLLKTDTRYYLEYQLKKLSETQVYRKAASELIRIRQQKLCSRS